jgi:hypothetical protein
MLAIGQADGGEPGVEKSRPWGDGPLEIAEPRERWRIGAAPAKPGIALAASRPLYTAPTLSKS